MSKNNKTVESLTVSIRLKKFEDTSGLTKPILKRLGFLGLKETENPENLGF